MTRNMKTSPSPAEMVGSIDDLLTEFFLRIPLKPLFRLKLVSKRWNSLISSPKLHSLRDKNKKPVGFIFHIPNPRVEFGKENAYVLSLDRSSPVGPPSITELDFAKDYLYASKEEYGVGNKICHSCNGLLVGYLCDYTSNTWDYDIKGYFVRNPTTREHKSIPRKRGLDLGLIRWLYLAFDPSKSPHYKIVCVLSAPRRHYKFAVYSSKTRSWKKYDNVFGSEYKGFEHGVYWNGSIHWICLKKSVSSIYFSPPDHDDDDDDENDEEDDDDDDDDDYDDDGDTGHHLEVLVMPTPPILEENSNNYFGESNDHLNFISYYGSDEYMLKVYEMRRDYSEWFVKYRVDVSNVWNKGLGSFAVCGLVRSKKGDDEDGSFLVLLIERKMVVYKVVDGSFEIASEFDEDECDDDDEYDIFYAYKSSFGHSRHFKHLSLDCPLQVLESCSSV